MDRPVFVVGDDCSMVDQQFVVGFRLGSFSPVFFPRHHLDIGKRVGLLIVNAINARCQVFWITGLLPYTIQGMELGLGKNPISEFRQGIGRQRVIAFG